MAETAFMEAAGIVYNPVLPLKDEIDAHQSELYKLRGYKYEIDRKYQAFKNTLTDNPTKYGLALAWLNENIELLSQRMAVHELAFIKLNKLDKQCREQGRRSCKSISIDGTECEIAQSVKSATPHSSCKQFIDTRSILNRLKRLIAKNKMSKKAFMKKFFGKQFNNNEAERFFTLYKSEWSRLKLPSKTRILKAEMFLKSHSDIRKFFDEFHKNTLSSTSDSDSCEVDNQFENDPDFVIHGKPLSIKQERPSTTSESSSILINHNKSSTKKRLIDDDSQDTMPRQIDQICSNSNKKRPFRFALTRKQTCELDKYFQLNNEPTMKDYEILSDRVGLTINTIDEWFTWKNQCYSDYDLFTDEKDKNQPVMTDDEEDTNEDTTTDEDENDEYESTDNEEDEDYEYVEDEDNDDDDEDDEDCKIDEVNDEDLCITLE